MGKRFLKIGHRGAMGYCEGNTLFAFEKAIELGCDMVELDVHFFNNKIVVVHDVPKRGKNYPLLDDVVGLINKRAKINIELKGDNTAEPTAKLLKKYIKKGWKKNDFIVSSFKTKELEDFKKISPEIKTGLLVKNRKVKIAKMAENLGVFSVNLSLKLARKSLIKKLRKKGFKVFVWTVNKKRNIKKLMSFGVDGIITDYPDRI